MAVSSVAAFRLRGGRARGALPAKVRSPVVEGIFYPSEAHELLAYIEALGLGKAGRARAILAPHSAWELAGPISVAAFAAAAGRPVKTVALLGPIHHEGFSGVYLTDSAVFDTPLGPAPVAQGLVEELASCGTVFQINDLPHLMEHSLEVLLPLVRHCFPQASIVPALLGGCRASHIRALAAALHLVFGPRLDETLFVVSATLGQGADSPQAASQAEVLLRLLENSDDAGILRAVSRGELQSCGAPLAAALLQSRLLEGAAFRRVTPPAIRAGSHGSRAAQVCLGALAWG